MISSHIIKHKNSITLDRSLAEGYVTQLVIFPVEVRTDQSCEEPGSSILPHTVRFYCC